MNQSVYNTALNELIKNNYSFSGRGQELTCVAKSTKLSQL